MDNNDMAAVPIAFTVKSTTYQLENLSIFDLAKLSRWARDEYYADMKKKLDALPVESEAGKKLSQEVATITVHDLTIKVREYMESVHAGIVEKRLMLKHSHPQLTDDEADALSETPEFKEAYRKLLPIKKEEQQSPPEEN